MHRNVVLCQVGIGGGTEEEQILSFTSSLASNQGWKVLVHFPKEYPEVYFPNMDPLFAIVFLVSPIYTCYLRLFRFSGVFKYTPNICDCF